MIRVRNYGQWVDKSTERDRHLIFVFHEDKYKDNRKLAYIGSDEFVVYSNPDDAYEHYRAPTSGWDNDIEQIKAVIQRDLCNEGGAIHRRATQRYFIGQHDNGDTKYAIPVCKKEEFTRWASLHWEHPDYTPHPPSGIRIDGELTFTDPRIR